VLSQQKPHSTINGKNLKIGPQRILFSAARQLVCCVFVCLLLVLETTNATIREVLGNRVHGIKGQLRRKSVTTGCFEVHSHAFCGGCWISGSVVGNNFGRNYPQCVRLYPDNSVLLCMVLHARCTEQSALHPAQSNSHTDRCSQSATTGMARRWCPRPLTHCALDKLRALALSHKRLCGHGRIPDGISKGQMRSSQRHYNMVSLVLNNTPYRRWGDKCLWF
jgi:hypothetical protein